MTNEEKILSTLAELSDRIEQGFAGMNSRFAEMEDRLAKQEQKSRKTAAQQQLQEEQIRQLTKCVRELAAQEPIWPGRSETATPVWCAWAIMSSGLSTSVQSDCCRSPSGTHISAILTTPRRDFRNKEGR